MTQQKSSSPSPVLVEVTRGGHVECLHRGHAVVVKAYGTLLHSWGDPDKAVYPRSSLKMIQALPLLESGAADAFGFTAREIALACASHNSEGFQTDQVGETLARLGLQEDHLECGPSIPLWIGATREIAKQNVELSRIHNNCSGKHAGFLAVARQMDVDPQGYIEPDHPVQQAITRVTEEMTGEDLSAVPCSADGCGIPVYAMSLLSLARGVARMTADDLPEARKAAAGRILDAMGAYPEYVAGTERFDTDFMRATKGRILTKVGAEGVHIAILRDHQIGVALKIEDGATRASQMALVSIMDRLGYLEGYDVAAFRSVPIKTTMGKPVGEIRGAL